MCGELESLQSKLALIRPQGYSMVNPVDWLGMLTTKPGLDRTLNIVTLCMHYYKSGPAFLVAILIAEKLYMVLGCL